MLCGCGSVRRLIWWLYCRDASLLSLSSCQWQL